MIGIFLCLQFLCQGMGVNTYRIPQDAIPKLLELYDRTAPGKIMPHFTCYLDEPCDKRNLCKSRLTNMEGKHLRFYCYRKIPQQIPLSQEIVDPKKWKPHQDCSAIYVYRKYYMKGCRVFAGTTSAMCGTSYGKIRPCINIQPIDGKWKNWRPWTHCTKSCGRGLRFRVRDCIKPTNGGKYCPWSSKEFDECRTNECPVDGKWKNWRPWTNCTKSCGGGQRSRTRECIKSTNGGKDCKGENKDSEECGTNECPEDLAKLSNKNGTSKLMFAIFGSMGAALVIGALIGAVIGAVMYNRKKRRNSAASTSTEPSYLYQESEKD